MHTEAAASATALLVTVTAWLIDAADVWTMTWTESAVREGSHKQSPFGQPSDSQAGNIFIDAWSVGMGIGGMDLVGSPCTPVSTADATAAELPLVRDAGVTVPPEPVDRAWATAVALAPFCM